MQTLRISLPPNSTKSFAGEAANEVNALAVLTLTLCFAPLEVGIEMGEEIETFWTLSKVCESKEFL